MFSTATNTINNVSPSSAIASGVSSSTNKSVCKCSDTYTCWNCMRQGAPPQKTYKCVICPNQT